MSLDVMSSIKLTHLLKFDIQCFQRLSRNVAAQLGGLLEGALRYRLRDDRDREDRRRTRGDRRRDTRFRERRRPDAICYGGVKKKRALREWRRTPTHRVVMFTVRLRQAPTAILRWCWTGTE